jgi:hypothetical protein
MTVEIFSWAALWLTTVVRKLAPVPWSLSAPEAAVARIFITCKAQERQTRLLQAEHIAAYQSPAGAMTSSSSEEL